MSVSEFAKTSQAASPRNERTAFMPHSVCASQTSLESGYRNTAGIRMNIGVAG